MDLYLAAIIQGLAYASMALGIYISLRIFNIPDITTDGSFTLGGAITAVGLSMGWNPLLVLILSVAGGAVAGSLTGIIFTRLRINALLAGILMMTALYSINLVIMGRSNLPLNNIDGLYNAGDQPAVIFSTIFVVILLICLLIIRLMKTDFGIAIRATGNNEIMAAANGVHVNWMKITGLGIANGLTALGGYLIVQYQGFADINMGVGIIISGLAAVMIGESLTGLFRIKNTGILVIAVVSGSILFRLILAEALTLGLNPNYLKLVTATIVLLIVGITRFRTKHHAAT